GDVGLAGGVAGGPGLADGVAGGSGSPGGVPAGGPSPGGGVALAAPPILMRPLPPPKSAVVPLPPAVLPAAGLAGVAAALVLPVDRPGVGWLLTGVAMTAAVVVADRRSRVDGQASPFTWLSGGWALLTLALLGMGAVRASGWLFVLCVLAAGVTGSLALVGKRTVNTILYDVLAVPLEALRAIPWAGRGVGRFTARRDGVARRIAL